MKTAIVTGANRGIGLEFCKQLKLKDYHVIATCRNTNAELENLGIQVESGIDVTDEDSLFKLSHTLKNIKLDLMINNAGVMTSESIDNLDLEAIRKQIEINTIAPLSFVKTLLHLLNNPAKLILVTSRMGSISDNTSGGYYGYRMSKAALNIAGVSLANDLKDRNIAVGIFHPGFVKTELTGNQGDMTANESVEHMLNRLEELNLDNSGTFVHAKGDSLAW